MKIFSGFELMAQGADKAQTVSMFDSMLPVVFLIGVFYFLVIRPQAKKNTELQKMMGSLKAGDEVFTTGGIIGRIKSISDTFVSVEVANNTVMKVLKAHISGLTKSKQEVVKTSKNPKKAKVIS